MDAEEAGNEKDYEQKINLHTDKVNAVPGVSVIMPVYNQSTFITRALLSLKKQSFIKWELIIVDDASTDNLGEHIAPFLDDKRNHLIRNHKNRGLGYI